MAEEARVLLAAGTLSPDSAILQFLRSLPTTAVAIEIDAARAQHAELVASGLSPRDALQRVASRFDRDQRTVASWLECVHY